MMLFLCECRYSIGSSTVTMCWLRSLLMNAIIAASDVDFPCPVGPVTRTNPRGSRHRSRSLAGRLRSSMNGMDWGITRAAIRSDGPVS